MELSLNFFEDELLDWISKGRKKTLQEIECEATADFKKNFRKTSTESNLKFKS